MNEAKTSGGNCAVSVPASLRKAAIEYRLSLGADGAMLERRLNEAADEIERLRAACERMMIGGNHIANWRNDHWPDYGSGHELAMTRLGPGREYDMWCCWNAIMCARATLEDTTPWKFQPEEIL